MDGFKCLKIKSSKQSQLFVLGFSSSDESTVASLLSDPIDPLGLTKGGPSRFGQQVITTKGQKGNEEDPFAVDVLTVPNKDQNPWNSWMRLGGFDFFANNPDRAAVCTWMGDVWLGGWSNWRSRRTEVAKNMFRSFSTSWIEDCR